jgi:O-antigen ligase
MPSRIASFFGDELVVGSFFLLFSPFFVSYFLKFYGHYLKTNLMIILIFIIISFLIGERSNFLKIFIIMSFIYFFILKINFKKKFFGVVLLLSLLSIILTFNSGAKYRYYEQIKSIYKKGGVTSYLQKSKYGAHYDTAYKMFKEYPLFGIGIKNFRVESGSKKYWDGRYKSTDGREYTLRWATHPHQTHFELLSETGLFGYLSFLIFITTSLYLSLKSYLKIKNFFHLSSMIYTVVFLIPFLPSGSFFSTFTSSMFWINYAIMMSYAKKH